MAQSKKRKKGSKAASRSTQKAKLRVGKKKAAKRKSAPKRKRAGRSGDVLETRGVELVSMSAVRPKARTARVGAGGGDYSGVSPVEGADAESPRELLEEGQTFESEAVSGVQNARNADQSEVTTKEVPEDDVPEEYLDPDRP